MKFSSTIVTFGAGIIGGIYLEKSSMTNKSKSIYDGLMNKIKPVFNSIIDTIKDILESSFSSVDFESFWINVKSFFSTLKDKIASFNSFQNINDKFEYLKSEILFFLNSIQKTFKDYKDNLITKPEILIE